MSTYIWSAENMYDNKDNNVYEWLESFENVWDAIPNIKEFISNEIKNLDFSEFNIYDNDVYIHKSVKHYQSAVIEGPCIINENCEIRPSAYIRGNVYVGPNCVLGNSCEFKNVLLMDNIQVPHFSYVGDSILGSFTHFGASSIASNFRQDKKEIKIHLGPSNSIQTNLRKMGVVTGDHVEIGCGSILNPGTLIGKNSRVYPLTTTRYAIPANKIYKSNGDLVDLRVD